MFLALDTETGGIGPDKSLLTLYMALFDDDLNPVMGIDADIGLRACGAVAKQECIRIAKGIDRPAVARGVRPSSVRRKGGLQDDAALAEPPYAVPLELSLKIKPDDGIYHATGEALGINKIDLAEHDRVAITYKQAGTAVYKFLEKCFKASKGQRLTPVGHGVAFDCRVIKEKLVAPGNWDKFVSYRTVDTCCVAQFMVLCGYLPKTLSCSTENLVEHFGVKKEGRIHDAKYDTLCCVEILRRMISLARVIPPTEYERDPRSMAVVRQCLPDIVGGPTMGKGL